MNDRLDVRKTYKLFVAGAFPRSESGRTYDVVGADGQVLAHAPLASRKDARDAVGAARGAQSSWAGRTAYNRAQILYRIAEMHFADEEAFRRYLNDQGPANVKKNVPTPGEAVSWIHAAGGKAVWAHPLARTIQRPGGFATLARQTVQAPLLRLDEGASRVFLLRPGVPVAQVVLQANNPGEIGYFLHGKDLSLTLGSWPVATEDMRPVPIAAGQTTRIDILFYPLPDSLGDEAAAALQASLDGNTMLLRLDGELFMDVLGVDSFPVPSGWSLAVIGWTSA